MNHSLITLIIDASGRTADIELPDNVPLRELLEPMLKGMNEWLSLHFQAEEFNLLISDDGIEWRSISIEQTLEQLQIVDGHYIRLEKSQSFSTA